MILIFKEQTFEVQQLHSYNSKSFIVDIVCDETNLFPTEFEEEDYMELFSKED